LLRARLVTLGPREHLLFLTVHHLTADRWSGGILARELAAIYGAAVAGRPAELPDLRLQFADYAAWRAEDRDKAFAAQRTYWKGCLSGAAPLPQFFPRPAYSGDPLASNRVRIGEVSAATRSAIRELCRQERATTFMA